MEDIYIDFDNQESHGLLDISLPSTSSQQQNEPTPFTSEFSARGVNSDVENDDEEFFVIKSSIDEPLYCRPLDEGGHNDDGGGDDDGNIRVYVTEAASMTSSITRTNWREGLTPPGNLTFNSAQGLQVTMSGDTPLHYLKLMVTDRMVETIARETNRYAAQVLADRQLAHSSRFRKWVETTPDEIWAFLGLIIAMGLIVIDSLADYWSMDEVYTLPFFSSVMTRDRFFLILQFLHLGNNKLQLPPDDPNYNPLSKFGSFVRDLTNNFRTVFLPGKNIAVDKATVTWRDRVNSRIHNPNQPVMKGIEVFQLCDCATSYCCNLEFYTGKIPTSRRGVAYDVVERLITPYLHAGRTLYVDNYFTTPDLFTFLRDRGTLACGTMRPNRENCPPKELTPRLKKGDTTITKLTDGKLNYIGFMDKVEVRMLTTAHNADTATFGVRPGGTKDQIVKLRAVHDYNQFMGAVDRCDSMVSSNAFKRRNLKWWKKAFFHMFMLGVLNAYLVCKSSSKRVCHRLFRRDLAKQLVQFMPLTQTVATAGRPLGPGNSSLFRLTGRHFPSMIVLKEGKTKNPQRECVVCSKRTYGRKFSRYECTACNVGLHVDTCFEIYHTVADYKNAASTRPRSSVRNKRKHDEVEK